MAVAAAGKKGPPPPGSSLSLRRARHFDPLKLPFSSPMPSRPSAPSSRRARPSRFWSKPWVCHFGRGHWFQCRLLCTALPMLRAPAAITALSDDEDMLPLTGQPPVATAGATRQGRTPAKSASAAASSKPRPNAPAAKPRASAPGAKSRGKKVQASQCADDEDDEEENDDEEMGEEEEEKEEEEEEDGEQPLLPQARKRPSAKVDDLPCSPRTTKRPAAHDSKDSAAVPRFHMMLYKATGAYGIRDRHTDNKQVLQVHAPKLKPADVKSIADKVRDALEGGESVVNAKELVKALREAMGQEGAKP